MKKPVVPVISEYSYLTFYRSGLNQGHTEGFLVVLNKSALKQKYTPHTDGYGLKKEDTCTMFPHKNVDTEQMSGLLSANLNVVKILSWIYCEH
jgi:hypothetical protein